MDRLKLFERSLLGKQVGGNGLLVIIDTVYLVSGAFFGQMDYLFLLRYVLFVNMLVTCILFQNLIVSRGEIAFELNTEKMVYYPITRLQYLLNKYAKALLFLLLQSSITLVGLWFGYYGNRAQLDMERIIGSLLVLMISILLTSGVSIISMHTMPMGIYLSMLLYLPLSYAAPWLQGILYENNYLIYNLFMTIGIILLGVILIWLFLLWIGVKVYERIN